MLPCLVQNFWRGGGNLCPPTCLPPVCTWAHKCACTCKHTHVHAHAHPSRFIYFPQDLRKEHNYRSSKSFHYTLLGLYCRDAVAAHTQPGKQLPREPYVHQLQSQLWFPPGHMVQYMFLHRQAWTWKSFFKNSDLQIYIFITHSPARELSFERGTPCGLSQNWALLEGELTDRSGAAHNHKSHIF